MIVSIYTYKLNLHCKNMNKIIHSLNFNADSDQHGKYIGLTMRTGELLLIVQITINIGVNREA